ncbi:MAG: M48 family metalloprotease [Acidobacteriota bacterium]
MKCPNCREVDLISRLTKQGVEVDYCPQCNGIWLEQGEIFYFTNNRRRMCQAIEKGMQNAKPGDRLSPRTDRLMHQWTLFAGSADEVQLDTCTDTGGIWFDSEELDKVRGAAKRRAKLSINMDRPLSTGEIGPGTSAGAAPALLQLPNLALRSAWTLGLLYGLLVLLLITAVEFAGLDPGVALLMGIAIALIQFVVGPWLMDLSLRFFYRLEWLEFGELPDHLQHFLERVCGRIGMKIPSMGLIRDGAPNAFTYGHHPDNARIVISQGILDLLEEDEVEAVVAHEIGHAKHWDMLLMTIVQLVPLIFYYIYRALMSTRARGSSRSDKGGGYQMAVAIGAYILYIISQYIGLWFSRTREYYADRFAGRVTRSPNLLSSALVKIAYGLAGKEKRKEKKEPRSRTLEALGALGIFDPGAAQAVAITSYLSAPAGGGAVSDELSKETIAGAMKWDLWNPWAKYYEFHSTHPLVANRMRYLGNQAESMGLEPFIRFDLRKPESYWDEFFVDLLMMWLPLIVASPFVLFAIVRASWTDAGLAIAAFAVGGLLKLGFSYRHGVFPRMNVASLLRGVKVSAVRPVPCTLSGTIIGRGVPGLIWSEDFVLQDESGIIFLDYRQPLRIWEFFFGLLRASELQNQAATVVGWYRRAPIPYLEMKSMSTADMKRNCYVYHMKLVSWIVLLLAGIALIVK